MWGDIILAFVTLLVIGVVGLIALFATAFIGSRIALALFKIIRTPWEGEF